MVDMFASMARVTAKVSSKTFSNSTHISTINARSSSDDVVTAAWDNTLGVHALIWVLTKTLPSQDVY